jgi:hypothetical protein
VAKQKQEGPPKPEGAREVAVQIGPFTVVGTRVECTFKFKPTDKTVRALNGMRDNFIGLQEPDIGQPKPYKHEYAGSNLTFSVKAKDKGTGKMRFDDNSVVVAGLRHVHETQNAEVILFDTQMEIPDEEETPEPDDGQDDLPEESE